MSEGEAAPAAVVEQNSRNLLMRVMAALVLAPLAIAIAYAGGWLWAALVTLAAIGLYVEWLMIVDGAREKRVVASGIVALAIAGFCLGSGRLDAALVVLAFGMGSLGLVLDRLGTPAWQSLLALIATASAVVAGIYRAQPLVTAVGARWSRAP